MDNIFNQTITSISNFFRNAITTRERDFEELIRNKDITRIKEKMSNRHEDIKRAINIYRVETHDISTRPDKITKIKDRDGKENRNLKKVWKLPVPYNQYINEISLVFLFGRPVKWQNQSEGCDEAFAMFQDIIKRTRFDAKIRQVKRIAGAETESALLFRVFKNNEGQPDVQIRVLAHSKGDELYYSWDIYGNLINAAWGYYTNEGDDIVYHFDIFTNEKIYRCVQKKGWDVVEEDNLIGKIPLIIFQQERETYGVEELINREEYIASHTADTNDYFADPILMASADVVKSLPKRDASNKTIIVENARDGVEKVAKFLTWDSASESKKQEIEWLQTQILSKSFTPNITLDSLKVVSQLSAKALRTVMMSADIKAAKHKEVYDEMLDRTASLIISTISNVLAIRLKGQCSQLKIQHEWQEPFGEDVADSLTNIVKAVDGGILSQESAIERNPLVNDVQIELSRIKNEQELATSRQNDLFGSNEEEIEPINN